MDALRRQQGISLISLMIGLLLSMLVVLAMLSVYKSTLRVTVDAGQGAQLSGQLSTGLLAAQKKLQGAGFLIDSASYGNEIVVLSDTTLSNNRLSGTVQSSLPGSGNAVVWREQNTCYGLVFTNQILYFLSTTNACSNASTAATSVAWTSTFKLVGSAGGDNRIAIEMVATAGDCKPFGVTDSAGALTIGLTANYLDSSGSLDTSRPSMPSTVCLPNFPATTT